VSVPKFGEETDIFETLGQPVLQWCILMQESVQRFATPHQDSKEFWNSMSNCGVLRVQRNADFLQWELHRTGCRSRRVDGIDAWQPGNNALKITNKEMNSKFSEV
jgi:hypothetical protein